MVIFLGMVHGTSIWPGPTKLAVTKPRHGNPLKGIGIRCDWGTGDADPARYAGINAKIDADKSGDRNDRGTNGVWRDS